jgi:hypothetical protein
MQRQVMQSQLDAAWHKGAAFVLDTIWSGASKAAWRRLRRHFCQAVLIMPILVSPSLSIADGVSKNHEPNDDGAMTIRDAEIGIGNASDFTVGFVLDSNARISSFNRAIARRPLRGKITKCSALIDLAVGIADGNHSYGGLCSYSENGGRASVMICNDEMVGHFQMIKIREQPWLHDLTDFVLRSCTGG